MISKPLASFGANPLFYKTRLCCRRVWCAAPLLLLLLALNELELLAQPIPKLNSLAPEWVQRGTAIEVKLNGENLTSVSALWFGVDPDSHQSGAAATDLKSEGTSLTAKITVTADAALGEREVRVVTP